MELEALQPLSHSDDEDNVGERGDQRSSSVAEKAKQFQVRVCRVRLSNAPPAPLMGATLRVTSSSDELFDA